MRDAEWFQGATFDAERKYRYVLWRRWSEAPALMAVMMNPSTADERNLDPTCNKMIGFAQRRNYGGLIICNAYAYRSTDPKQLKQTDDPIGPANDVYLLEEATNAGMIVCGWGKIPLERHRRMLELLKPFDLWAFKINQDGTPSHPLYLKLELFMWRPKEDVLEKNKTAPYPD